MLNLLFGLTFAVSFATYSILRQFDVASTKAFSKYLDMEKHEVNPLVNWLLKRGLSLDQSFTVMLFLVGIPIAFVDAAFNTYLALGIPLFAWFVGCFHVVASANNYGYLPKLERMSPKEIREAEADMFAFGMEFGKANLRKKLMLLWNRKGLDLSMTLLSIVAFASIYYSVWIVGLVQIETLFATHGFYVLSFFNMGWVLAFALLAYYPVKVMAEITMANRYYHLSKGMVTQIGIQDELPSSGWIDVPVDHLKNAIKIAEANNSKVVRIWLGSPDTQTT
jgi:hypothetical protein